MKRITIVDLSRELGLSLGTINKALNGKPGVSHVTRQKVLIAADKLGYKVNRAAQGLARNTISIGIIMPRVWHQFYGYLKLGIDNELENLSDYNIIGVYYYVPDLHSHAETVDAFRKCFEDGMNAVIICPAHECEYENWTSKMHSHNIPVIALGSDLKDENRLCCIRINASMSGHLAAEYLSKIIDHGKSVAVYIGNKDMNDHREKANGFLDEAKTRNLSVAGIYEAHDEPSVAYFLTNKLIKERPDIGGFYIATANSVSVCQYIEENEINGLCIVGTDINPEICQYMKKDILQGVIFQDTINQGRTAVRTVVDYLVRKQHIENSILISPQLMLMSNMNCYDHEYKLFQENGRIENGIHNSRYHKPADISGDEAIEARSNLSSGEDSQFLSFNRHP